MNASLSGNAGAQKDYNSTEMRLKCYVREPESTPGNHMACLFHKKTA